MYNIFTYDILIGNLILETEPKKGLAECNSQTLVVYDSVYLLNCR